MTFFHGLGMFIYNMAALLLGAIIAYVIIWIINIASGQINIFYNISSFIQKLTKTKKKIVKLKRKGPMPHNGYRAFNINNLKRNFKNIKITLIQEGLLKYYLKKKYENWNYRFKKKISRWKKRFINLY